MNRTFRDYRDLNPRMMLLRKWMLEEWSGLHSGKTKIQMCNYILKHWYPEHIYTLEFYERYI